MATVLVSAMIFALSEFTMNSIFNDTVKSFVASTDDYVFPNEFFQIDQGYMKNPLSIMVKNMEFLSLSIADYEISLLTPDSFDITISNITTSLYFNWEYSLRGMSDHGNAMINIQSMSLSIEIILQNLTYIKTTAGQITSKIKDLTVEIIQPGNSNSNWIFTMFKSDLSNLLTSMLAISIRDAINSFEINPMYLVLNNTDIAFDYSLSKPPQVTASFLEFDSLGIFVQNSTPNYNPPIPPPASTPISSAPGFQVVITDYTLNSYSFSAFTSGYLGFNITNSNLPATFPIKLTTTVFGFFVPELIDTYGLGKDIEIFCSFKQPPQIRFINESSWNLELAAEGYLICKIIVDYTQEALVLGLEISGDLQGYLQNWVAKGQIHLLQVDQLDVITNNANADTSTLKNAINAALTTYITSVNIDYLEKGVELPTSARFNLSDAEAYTGNGYLYMLINPKVTVTIADLYN